MNFSRGSILVITLWSLCLLAFFAVYTGYLSRQKIVFMQRISARDDLHFIAESGVKLAFSQISADQTLEVDSLKDSWSDSPGLLKDSVVGNGSFSVSYDYTDIINFRIQKRFGAVDEESKININKADRDTLTRLFLAMNMEPPQANDLAVSIMDWRDSDSFLLDPIAGAEDSYYTLLKEPYESKDAQFENLLELKLVRGVTQDIFDKIKDYVCIFGDGRVNINTCSGVVLSALGVGRELIDRIMLYRHGVDSLLGTDDDGVFTDLSMVGAELAKSVSLSDAEISQVNDLASSGGITVSSNFFTINSFAILDSWKDKPAHQITCVVKRTGEVLGYNEF